MAPVRISDLPSINQQLGRAQADALILAITNTLNSFTVGIKEAFTGRLNGSDFAVLLPNTGNKDDALGHLILKDIHQVAKKWLDPEAYIFVGATSFKFQDKVSEVLTKADEVLRGSPKS